MKVQFDDGRVRLRAGRAEFDALRGGDALRACVAWPALPWRIEVVAGEVLGAECGGGTVRLALPRADLDALAGRLPCRDGLRYAVELPEGTLDLHFEVDLHDGRTRRR